MRYRLLGKAMLLALTAIGATFAIGAPAAFAGEPASSRCSELLPGGTANTPDPVRAGPAPPLPASWAKGSAGLPKHVFVRSSTATYNRLYEFALADGDLFARRRGGEERWRAVPLPECLEGQLTGISADDDEMIGLDDDRNVYTMDNRGDRILRLRSQGAITLDQVRLEPRRR